MRRGRAPLFTGVPLAAVVLAGCGDPLDRPGTWRAGDVNAANLAVAATDKRDLVVGQPDGPADGRLAAEAVDRLLNDKAKTLNAVATTPGAN